MSSSSISRKAILGGIKQWAPKGSAMKAALKTAAEFGVKRGLGGVIRKSQATKLMKELKNEHLLKSRVGTDKVSTYGTNIKKLLKEVVPNPTEAHASDIANQRLAEKKEILKGAGLRVDTVKKPATKDDLHVAKVNMDIARDEGALKELGLEIPGTADGKVSVSDAATEKKSSVPTTAAAGKRLSAAEQMNLAPSFTVPHGARENNKETVVGEKIALASSKIDARPTSSNDRPETNPERVADAPALSGPEQEPGDATKAVELQI